MEVSLQMFVIELLLVGGLMGKVVQWFWETLIEPYVKWLAYLDIPTKRVLVALLCGLFVQIPLWFAIWMGWLTTPSDVQAWLTVTFEYGSYSFAGSQLFHGIQSQRALRARNGLS